MYQCIRFKCDRLGLGGLFYVCDSVGEYFWDSVTEEFYIWDSVTGEFYIWDSA